MSSLELTVFDFERESPPPAADRLGWLLQRHANRILDVERQWSGADAQSRPYAIAEALLAWKRFNLLADAADQQPDTVKAGIQRARAHLGPFVNSLVVDAYPDGVVIAAATGDPSIPAEQQDMLQQLLSLDTEIEHLAEAIERQSPVVRDATFADRTSRLNETADRATRLEAPAMEHPETALICRSVLFRARLMAAITGKSAVSAGVGPMGGAT